jgi:hypothetical protein
MAPQEKQKKLAFNPCICIIEVVLSGQQRMVLENSARKKSHENITNYP